MIELLNLAFDCDVKGPAKAVLLVLADHCNKDGKCWPSRERIAQRSGFCQRTVRSALYELERLGYLKMSVGKSDKPASADERKRAAKEISYRLTLREPRQEMPSQDGRPWREVPSSMAGGAKQAWQEIPEPRQEMPREPLEPSIEPLRKPHKQRERVTVDDSAREEFWQSYPKEKRVGKGAFRKAYVTALKRGATPAQLLWAVRHTRWSEEARFIPHPATWLNQDRWEDDPAAEPPTSRTAKEKEQRDRWASLLDNPFFQGPDDDAASERHPDSGAPIIDAEDYTDMERRAA